MATTQIADIIVPSIFMQYVREMTAENAAVFQSGLVVDSAELSAEMARGGNAVHVPFWQDLSGADDVQSDDPNTLATAKKITAAEQIAAVLRRVGTFSAADLAAALAGDDPMRVVADRIAPWWARNLNAAAIKVLAGVVGALEAGTSGSALIDIGITAGTIAAANKVSADAVIDAKGLLGDAADKLSIFFVHSAVYQNLQKLNLIDFIPDARGEVNIPTYLGMRLVQSDTLPLDTGTANYPLYDSYIVAPGAVQFGETSAKVPVETYRQPLQGNGAGVEYFVTRRDFALHPVGMKYSGTISGAGPANSALATAGNWSRVFERKNIGIVAIRSNG